jgi:Protein of unknown function (DUF2778)
MRNRIGALQGFDSFNHDQVSRQLMMRSILGAGALAVGLLAGFWGLHDHAGSAKNEATSRDRIALGPDVKPLGSLLVDVRSHLRQNQASTDGPVIVSARQHSAQLETAKSDPSVPPITSSVSSTVASVDVSTEAAEPSITAEVTAPMPPRRPSQLKLANGDNGVGQPFRATAQQGRKIVAAAPVQDNRSFFEKFFGGAQTQDQQRPAGQALAYAAPETGSLGRSLFGGANPAGRYDRYTAVYDISARTVYMPDGTRLEAHSGLGSRLDDPHYVHERMHGATPPHTYNLTMREALFHGVEAIRLNPVGSGNIFGRAGLLAHTYMLGPNGDSNGCVSFRNYDAFLRAFKNGEIKRLVVVARAD